MAHEVFSLIPSDTVHYLYLLFFSLSIISILVALFAIKPKWVKVLVIVWGLVMGSAGLMVLNDSKAQFYVSETNLVIDTGLFDVKRFPFSALERDKARLIDVSKESGYRLWYKTRGTGMPNFNTGWFVLRNDQKAYVFTTDMTKPVIYIPTKNDYVLLFSVENAEKFLEVLQES